MAAETERKKKNKENLTKRNYDLFVTHILTGTGRSPIVVFVHVQ